MPEAEARSGERGTRGMLKPLWIAWREFKHTALTKAFILAAIGVPLLAAGSMAIAAVMMSGSTSPPLLGTIAIVDPTGEVIEAAAHELDPATIARDRLDQARQVQEALGELAPGLEQAPLPPSPPGTVASSVIDLDIEPHGDGADLDALKARLRAGDLVAVAVIDPALLAVDRPPANGGPAAVAGAESPFRIYLAQDVDPDHSRLLERRLGQAIVRARAARTMQDLERIEALLDRPRARTIKLLEDGQEAREGAGVRELQEIIPFVFMLLLWISTFTAGQHLMMSTIEEKSNRVMEVLLSAVSPLQLMFGKILGQGLVGLIIVMIYASLGIACLIVFAVLHLVPIIQLVYLAVYFFMAYFMIASIMAAVGSAVSDIREANSLLMPAMLVLMFPFLLWLPISEDPNGPVASIFSFIPPAIPFVMILRLPSAEAVPLWQIPATIVWGYACVLGMIWLAAKIFRVGVLMYGKPPSPLQLIKWVRYS